MIKTQKPQLPQQNLRLRPHEATLLVKILKVLAYESKSTMAIYRQLRNNIGFRNHHSFYRQLNFSIKHRLIELAKVEKKWGIPTKTYRLTEKGKNLLQLLGETAKYR